uniref:Sulfhydryl oxidase n=1 Tax=Acrobeloides nanus TaxID=290746 RepID=A0A914DUX3_9BILA
MIFYSTESTSRCGYCRNFMPTYKEFARQIQGWGSVVKVAAINCADSFNTEVCCANGIQTIPTMKYFPRNTRNYTDGIKLTADSHSLVRDLKEELLGYVINDYNQNKYEDWPKFQYMEENGKANDLWTDIDSANFSIIVFEQNDTDATQLMMDLYPYKNQVDVKRAQDSSPLLKNLEINEYPYVVMYKKGEDKPVFMAPYDNETTLQEILSRAVPADLVSTTQKVITTTEKIEIVNCTTEPEKCKQMFYVSETDILKSLYSALLGDIIRKCDFIQGQNFTDLHNFVNLLAEHFPTKTSTGRFNRLRARRSENPTSLERSEKAKQMFGKLKELLDQKPGNISVPEWKETFEKLEYDHGFPFPTNSSWQHCKGSTPLFRGYSCGLWTTFHTLTVYTYMDAIKDPNFNPLQPLQAIQGWVRSYLWCSPCRKHFMNMTTLDNELPMDERNINTKEDIFMYLWQAHNRVNKRLHGEGNKFTEDPQFVKNQFPPEFLCPNCHMEGESNKDQVRDFMLDFYSNIKPHQEDAYVNTNEI